VAARRGDGGTARPIRVQLLVSGRVRVLHPVLADCYDQAQARHGERVELDPSVIAPAIGVGADQVWRTLTRLDRVSPITLTPSDDGVNVVTLPMAWPPVKGIISAKVDAALASGWVLAVKP
jgi:hypothetical protein